jgi:hypothetical protein
MFAIAESEVRSPQEMRTKVQNELKKGAVSCCEVVKMLDMNDPNRTILYHQTVAIKLNIEQLACLRCNAYINYILEHFKPQN